MTKNLSGNSISFYSRKSILTLVLVSLAYLLLSSVLVGFKNEQVFLVILFNACYFISTPSRNFITGFSVFIIYWIIFDYMKAFPNYKYNAVHIESLYSAEKTLFGIHDGGKLVTFNEYWLNHHNKFLDLLCGFFYISWIPLPLAFAIYLFYKDRRQFLYFSLTFFFVNILGFIIYYIFPAAPPWYIQLNGSEFIPFTPGNTAGLGRFDQLLNIDIFKSIYAKSSNVFAAMPSLHSSYPLIVTWFGLKNKFGWINIFFAFITIGIWFAAVYTSHHYTLDVLAGIACGLTGILLFQWILKKTPALNKMIEKFTFAIT